MKKSIVFAALLLCSMVGYGQQIIDLSKGRKTAGPKCETVDCFVAKLTTYPCERTTIQAKMPNDSLVPVFKNATGRLVIIRVSKKTNKAYLGYVDTPKK